MANFKLKTVRLACKELESDTSSQSHLPDIFSLFPPTVILTADSPEVQPGRGKPFPDIFLAAAHALGACNVGSPSAPRDT